MVVSLVTEEFPGVLDTPKPKHLIALTNAGTQTRVKWHDVWKFKYMFFTLGACIEGFKSMRKLIMVDATYLKHLYGGVLIYVMAQDPDHHHYQIAFGVVDGENEASWMWFMETCKMVVPDHHELMFISDRNVSLIKFVHTVFPLSQHGYCIWHLFQNVKASVYGAAKDTIVGEFMKCAKAYTECEFITLYGAFKWRNPHEAVYLGKVFFLKNGQGVIFQEIDTTK